MDQRIVEFTRSLTNSPRDQHRFNRLTDLFVREMNWGALIDLTNALKRNKGGVEAELYPYLASRLRRIGELTEELNEKARIFVALGFVYEEHLKQPQAALDSYSRACKMAPTLHTAVDGKVRVLQGLGRTAEALALLRSAAADTENLSWRQELLYEVARISELSGEREAAADARAAALALDEQVDTDVRRSPRPPIPAQAAAIPELTDDDIVTDVRKKPSPPETDKTVVTAPPAEWLDDSDLERVSPPSIPPAAPPKRRPATTIIATAASPPRVPPRRTAPSEPPPLRASSVAPVKKTAPVEAPPPRRTTVIATADAPPMRAPVLKSQKLRAEESGQQSVVTRGGAKPKNKRPKRDTAPAGSLRTVEQDAVISEPPTAETAAAPAELAKPSVAAAAKREPPAKPERAPSARADDAPKADAVDLSALSAQALARQIASNDADSSELPALLAEANRRAFKHPVVAGSAIAFAERAGATVEDRMLAASLLLWAERGDDAIAALPPADASLEEEALESVLRFLRKRLERLDAAEPWYKRLRRKSPRNEEVTRYQIYAWREEGNARRLAVALQSLRDTLEPSDDEWHALGVELADLVESELESPDRAFEIWRELFDEGIDRERASAEIRRLLRSMGRYSALADQLRRVIESGRADASDEQQIEVYEELAQIYQSELGEPQLALETWERLVAEIPTYEAGRIELAEALLAAGRSVEAMNQYRELAASAGESRQRAHWLAKAGLAGADSPGMERDAALLLEESLVLHPGGTAAERAAEREKLSELWAASELPHTDLRSGRMAAIAMPPKERVPRLQELVEQAERECPDTPLHAALLEDLLRLEAGRDELWLQAAAVIARLDDSAALMRAQRLRLAARPDDEELELSFIGQLFTRPADRDEAAELLSAALSRAPSSERWQLLLQNPAALKPSSEAVADALASAGGPAALDQAIQELDDQSDSDALISLLRGLLEHEQAPRAAIIERLEVITELSFDEGRQFVEVLLGRGDFEQALALWSELRARFSDESQELDALLVKLTDYALTELEQPARIWPALSGFFAEGASASVELIGQLRAVASLVGEEAQALKIYDAAWAHSIEDGARARLGCEALTLASATLPQDDAQVMTWLERRLDGLKLVPLQDVESDSLVSRGHKGAWTRLVESAIAQDSLPLQQRAELAERWLMSSAAGAFRLERRLSILEPLGPPESWTLALQAELLSHALEARRHELVLTLGEAILEKEPQHDAAAQALPALLTCARLQRLDSDRVKGWVDIELEVRGEEALHKVAEQLIAYVEPLRDAADVWRPILNSLKEPQLAPSALRALKRWRWQDASDDRARDEAAMALAQLPDQSDADREDTLDIMSASWSSLVDSAEARQLASELATETGRLAGLASRTEAEAEERTGAAAAALHMFAAKLHAARPGDEGDEDALDSIRQAVAADPGDVSANELFAAELKRLGYGSEAATALVRLASLRSGSSEALSLYVEALELADGAGDELGEHFSSIEGALAEIAELDDAAIAALDVLAAKGATKRAWSVVEALKPRFGDELETPPWPLRLAGWAAEIFGPGSDTHLEKLEEAWRAAPEAVGLLYQLVRFYQDKREFEPTTKLLGDALELLNGPERMGVLAALIEAELAAEDVQNSTMRLIVDSSAEDGLPEEISPELVKQAGLALDDPRWIDRLAQTLESSELWEEAAALRMRSAELSRDSSEAWRAAAAALEASGASSALRMEPELRAALLSADPQAALDDLLTRALQQGEAAPLRQVSRSLMDGDLDDDQLLLILLISIEAGLSQRPPVIDDQLLDELSEAEMIDPAEPRVYALAARAAKHQQRWDDAVAALQQQADTEMSAELRFEILREQAMLRWQELSDLDGAGRVLDRALLLRPEDTETLEILVSLHIEREDWQEALAILRRIGRQRDENAAARALIRAALIYRDELEDPDGCISLLRDSLSEFSENEILLQEAASCLEEIASAREQVDDAEAWELAKLLLSATDDWSDAAKVQLLRWQTAAGEADADTWAKIAALSDNGQSDDALTWMALSRCLIETPEDLSVLDKLSALAEKTGEVLKAAEQIRDAAAPLEGDAKLAFLVKASELGLSAGESEFALSAAKAAHEHDPAADQAIEALREAAVAAEQHRELVAALERSADKVDSPQRASKLLAEAGRLLFFVLDDAEAGAALLANAAGYAPLSEDDHKILVSTYEAAGRWDEAVDALLDRAANLGGRESVESRAAAALICLNELADFSHASDIIEDALDSVAALDDIEPLLPALEVFQDKVTDEHRIELTHILARAWPEVVALDSWREDTLAVWMKSVTPHMPEVEAEAMWIAVLSQTRWSPDIRWKLRAEWLKVGAPLDQVVERVRDAAIEEEGAWESLRHAVSTARAAQTEPRRKAMLAWAEAEVALFQQDLPEVAHTLALLALRELPDDAKLKSLLERIQARSGSDTSSKRHLEVELERAQTAQEKLVWAARLARLELRENADAEAAISTLWSVKVPEDQLQAAYLEIVDELSEASLASLRAAVHEAASKMLRAPASFEAIRAAAREYQSDNRSIDRAWRLWATLEGERPGDPESIRGAVINGILSGQSAAALQLMDNAIERGLSSELRVTLEAEAVELLLRQGMEEDVEEAVRRLGVMAREGLRGSTARRRLFELLSEPLASRLAGEALLERIGLDGTREERVAVYELLVGGASGPSEVATWRYALGEEWMREPINWEHAYNNLLIAHRNKPSRGIILEALIEAAIFSDRAPQLADHLASVSWPKGTIAPGAIIGRLERMKPSQPEAHVTQAQSLRDSTPEDELARALWLAVLKKSGKETLWLNEARDALARGLLQRMDVWRWRIASAAAAQGDPQLALRHAQSLADDGRGSEALAAMELIVSIAKQERTPSSLAALRQVQRRAADLALWPLSLSVLEARLVLTDKPSEKLTLYTEMADLRLSKLGDPDGTFDVLCAALSDLSYKPELLESLVEMAKGDVSRAMRLSFILGDLADTEESPSRARLLRKEAARLADEEAGDPEVALEHLEELLELNMADVEAADKALSLLDRLDLPEEQVRWLQRLLDTEIGPEVDSARARRLAVLAEERLAQPELAISALQLLKDRGLANKDDLSELKRLIADHDAED